jgi:hypothetical protein
MQDRPATGERARRARPRGEQELRDHAPAGRGDGREGPAAGRRRQPKPIPATAAAEAGLEQIASLTGKEVEGVIAVQPTDGGWLVGVEVLEDRRVPSTADMLASYEAELDSRGNLLGYRRTSRYVRGRADSASSTS